MLNFALSAMKACPAAIATTLLLTGDAGHGAKLAIIMAVVLSICLICMLCFISASLIARMLGRTGINGIAADRASLP